MPPRFRKYSQEHRDLYSQYNDNELRDLLFENWSRPYEYESFTEFKERPFKGKYVNISEYGFRAVKNQGPWPPDKKNFNIFLFGGSTSFGYGVADSETTASYLEDFISKDKKIYVYNFGRGSYCSSQELILYENLIKSGNVPNMALFIDGLNDFGVGYQGHQLASAFRQYMEADSPGIIFQLTHVLAELPVGGLVTRLQTKFSHAKDERTDLEKQYNDLPLLDFVIHRYLENKKMIEAVSAYYGVKPIFVWQPVPTYHYNLKHYPFKIEYLETHYYTKYGYPRMARIVKQHRLGSNFLWCADIQSDAEKLLYVDLVHYSSDMSKTLAKQIANFLIQRKMLDVGR